MQAIKIIILLYIMSLGGMYYISTRSGGVPPLLPGDIYRVKGPRRIYFPMGSALIITILIYLFFSILKQKFLPTS